MSILTIRKITLRPAIGSDIPFLLDLRCRTMTAHQQGSGPEPSDEERLRRVLYRFDCADIIMESSKPVGLLKVARDGTQWELIQIQLDPSLQGSGIGKELLTTLISEAKNVGSSLKLSVLKANPARSLYERLGFQITHETPHAYEMHLQA